MPTWFQNALRGTDVTTQGRPTDRWDWAIAVALGVLVAFEVVVDRPELVGLELLSAAVALVVLPFRRQIPFRAAVFAFSAQLAADLVAVALGGDGDTTFGHGIAGLLLIYALCRWPTPRAAVLGMAITMSFVVIGEFLDGGAWWQNLLFLIPWLILGLLALAMRYRAMLGAQHDDQIRLTERNTLARELHDSVAHHVSAIAIQAQAAQFVAKTDPDAAIEAMGTVEEVAQTAIEEMMHLVGVLRRDVDPAHMVVATTLAGLADPAGTPRVTIVGQSDLSSLPGPVAAAVYRIAQESVTNARRHSRNARSIDIDMATGSDAVDLIVVNDGTPTTRNRGSGYGLVGMTERVASFGGTILSGPSEPDGWRVHATVPLGRPE